MLTGRIGLAAAILGANVRSPALPYKLTFVATYHCNFRCEMCNIWQKKSVNEMSPEEVGLFFDRWPQFRWVHLTGGELFMRRDLDDLVAAIQANCFDLRELWAGDRRRDLREAVVDERCSHCWTPCEAYPTILGHLVRSLGARGSELQAGPAEGVR